MLLQMTNDETNVRTLETMHCYGTLHSAWNNSITNTEKWENANPRSAR
jgi:hypothetical protein